MDLGVDRDEDAAEVDEAARQLQRELLELDVDDVQRRREGAPPPGARAVDAAMLGGLAVTAGKDVIGAVVRAIVQWIGRRSDRTVKLTIGEDSIELSSVSAEDQRRLVESFLARHASET
ncbi:MAG TPA: hypothetical protein VGF91_13995 [Solirubrobacteraceae bacterium]